MKLFQKKKNNKGFSLVELIVVVAIMAVLLGVLVPTLVRHVESSKHQKDLTAVGEIRNAFEIALANEDYSNITATIEFTGATITVDPTKTTAKEGEAALVDGYLAEVVHNLAGSSGTSFSYGFKSKIAKDADKTKTTITIANETVTAVVHLEEYGDDEIE